MTPRLPLALGTRLAAAAAAIVVAAPISAQLPFLIAPVGTLRMELRGDFFPVSNIWVDAARRPLGELIARHSLDAAATPLVAEVDRRLAAIVGPGAGPGSLGALRAVAEYQRGVGTIGLALGLTSRITLIGNLPIVSTRTQTQLTFDPAGATLGVNPADALLGNAAGFAQTNAFFAQYDAALAELGVRVGRGDYASNPTTLALAQQTLAAGPATRGALFELLADPRLASAVLPVTTSVAGTALLELIAALRMTYSSGLGIPGFDAAPALPQVPISGDAFELLLDAATGFGLSPRNTDPRVALGDVELGVVVEALRAGNAASASAFSLVGRGLARLPTGQTPRADALLDQGSGDAQLDIELGAIVEARHGRMGIRAEVTYVRQFAGDLQARLGSPAQALLPARYLAAVRRDPGDVIALSMQPYVRLAPHLAVSGMVQHQRRGSDVVTLIAGQPPVAGATPADLTFGTKADATRIGIGLSYAHEGRNREGILKMPVEASFQIERTVASGAGIVPAAMTTRVMVRVYKQIF